MTPKGKAASRSNRTL